ncbi:MULTISPECIES: methylglyoxal synthase [unclassified Cetobacterium]|uniref:methylglyoxal synthase n=1 Tax=unclassified Cetobacterium TaxID=2630983 RepID=UPI00163D0261|nr:methylglyoxal synthase [Cetobacterium sp. 8H]MBC2852014.1 methylglyoxal synthase [Cetobacterium sp. 8H]
MKKIALIAHDNMKPEMVTFAKKNEHILAKYPLVSTGTTGLRIMETTGLTIHRFKSGPIGGDQQIGAEVAMDNIKAILFFRDPLTSQPHEPDISALIRIADVHKVPIATNLATAELLILGLDK